MRELGGSTNVRRTALIGAFRITVRDGTVTKAVGLDDSGRRVVKDNPDAVPTIGQLLDEWEQAQRDGADTAEVKYATGQPVKGRHRSCRAGASPLRHASAPSTRPGLSRVARVGASSMSAASSK